MQKDSNSKSSEDLVQAKSKPKKRILCADDEETLLSIFSECLALQNYDVVEAQNGQQAIDLFKVSPRSFDCVLLDLSMPKVNGDEAAKMIRELNPDVPIILMSGYDENEIIQSSNKMIISATLQKPITINELLEKVDSVLKE